MADYITTSSGIHFYPTDPDINDISINDIAHALPMICRGNGHLKSFYSVGQHCIHCAREAEARGYSPRMILAALLHDASECYLSDVPRPFKKTLITYNQMEDYLLSLIYCKFLGSVLSDNEEMLLRKIDDDLLYYDLEILLSEPQSGPPPILKVPVDYTFVSFDKVEQQYLRLFNKYRSRI